MLWRLKSTLRRLRVASRPMRERGLSRLAIAFRHVPAAFMLRAWRVLAQRCNRALLHGAFNRPRFMAFQDRLPASTRPRLYVIVMPHTLHFLLPCLALLQDRAQLVLVGNGERRWERRLLRERFPALPLFELRTLPLSSAAHGDVISLLLAQHRGNFGIVDHDCYVFDEALFEQLHPAADECLLAEFSEASETVDTLFPLTFFLYFNAEPLRQLMLRHGIDARLYREPPAQVRDALASIGLGRGVFWKHYHNFHDTLHVLLGVALSEGSRVRFLSSGDDMRALHVGGTSIGSHHTKPLPSLYIHRRFLEFLDDPLLNERYAFLTAPLRSAAEVLARCDPADPVWETLPVVDTLMLRLAAALPDPSRRSRGALPAAAAATARP